MKHIIIKRTVIATAILLSAALAVQAYAEVTNDGMASASVVKINALLHYAKKKPAAPRPDPSVVTYNRDSPDPNVGWHTVGGMRMCTQDCDNPEIPGSGYVCRNVNIFGMTMRECDWSSW